MAAKKTRKQAPKQEAIRVEGLPVLLLPVLAIFVFIISIWPNNTGFIGDILRPSLQECFGFASPLLGLWLFIFGVGLLIPHQKTDHRLSALGLVLLQVTAQLGSSALAAWKNLDLFDRTVYRSYGGIMGSGLYSFIAGLVGPIGFAIAFALLILVVASLLTRKPPLVILLLIGKFARKSMPTPEQRQRIAQQGREVLDQTRLVAERAVEMASEQPTEAEAEWEENRKRIMAMAMESSRDATLGALNENPEMNAALQLESSSMDTTTALQVEREWQQAREEVRRRRESEAVRTNGEAGKRTPPQQMPEATGPLEWWMPKPQNLPYDEDIILPPSGGTERLEPRLGVARASEHSAPLVSSMFYSYEANEFEQSAIDHAALQAKAVLPLVEEFPPFPEEDLELFYENYAQDNGVEATDEGEANTSGVFLGESNVSSLSDEGFLPFEPLQPITHFDVDDTQLNDIAPMEPSSSADEPERLRTNPIGQQAHYEPTGGSAVPTYNPPPLSLLASPTGRAPVDPDKLADNIMQLEQTLQMFNVKATVVDVSQGPTVTRYELQLAPGIRVNRVANLADDIAMALAAVAVRIEAPIPGKAAVGIEVPNQETQSVMISEILTNRVFREARHPLTVALGKDITGKPIVANIADAPHLLIAGTTGSGKSVCMNALICSILYRCSPEQVRMIMVDPKVVEMSNYNGIPHLLAPVVTDPKKAATVLKIATQEMDRRYELFATLAVKNIGQFNAKVQEEQLDLPLLPYWLIFIDELADLMMIAKESVEHAITRISQLARAAGIHLVVGTQRPTTDVVTGIIKSNVPSRIAFAVSSSIDSRIILDANGAERLLGRGDMLFQLVGSHKPIRIQGAFISEKEVDAVVAHVKGQGTLDYSVEVALEEEEEIERTPNTERDPLFLKAAHLVIEERYGSTSYLQRRLSVGYSRAGRIMDQLQDHGVVGPAKGSKPREVLMTIEQLDQFR